MSIDVQILARELSKHIQPSPWPRWMSLRQAAQYSGWGEKKLIELASHRKISGFQDEELKTRPWTFDRDSIDNFRIKQSMLADDCKEEAERAEKALEILNSVRI